MQRGFQQDRRRFVVGVLLACLSLPAVSGADVESKKIRNVLFIVSDDLKASSLGCYGNTVCRTPNIDRLASSGMVFDRAYCQGTVCGPSRTSFMFSRYRKQGQVTMGQHLWQNGWYSARVGKIFHMKVPAMMSPGTFM